MQLTTKTKDLRAALAAVKPAVSTRTTLPVLSSVLLTATDGLRLTATNLDTWIETDLIGTVESAGGVCLPFAPLDKASSRWANETTKLEIKGAAAHFTCGESRLTLPFIAPDEFPTAPERKLGKPQLSAEFCQRIAQCQPFTSEAADRPVLNGVWVGDHMEASDGNMLVRVPGLPGADFIIPNATCSAIADMEGEATVALGDDLCSVTVGDVRLLSKRIEGNWPNTSAIIPDSSAYAKINCNREELLNAVLYCSTVASELRFTPLRLKVGKDSILASIQRDKGDDRAEQTVAAQSPVELSICFSVERFLKTLRAFSAETIELRLKDEMSPIVIEQDDCTVVLMPIRIQ